MSDDERGTRVYECELSRSRLEIMSVKPQEREKRRRRKTAKSWRKIENCFDKQSKITKLTFVFVKLINHFITSHTGRHKTGYKMPFKCISESTCCKTRDTFSIHELISFTFRFDLMDLVMRSRRSMISCGKLTKQNAFLSTISIRLQLKLESFPRIWLKGIFGAINVGNCQLERHLMDENRKQRANAFSEHRVFSTIHLEIVQKKTQHGFERVWIEFFFSKSWWIRKRVWAVKFWKIQLV